VREKVEEVVIELEYCSTKEMTADLLTKALPRVQFEYLRKKLCVVDVAQGGLLESDQRHGQEGSGMVSRPGPKPATRNVLE
jgi:hypothetical protein